MRAPAISEMRIIAGMKNGGEATEEVVEGAQDSVAFFRVMIRIGQVKPPVPRKPERELEVCLTNIL